MSYLDEKHLVNIGAGDRAGTGLQFSTSQWIAT